MTAPLPSAEIAALLGAGTRFAGKLQFEGRVRIDGAFQGEIRSEGTLIVGAGAEIDGEVDVGVLVVRGGTVRANVRARELIELHVPAVVAGDLVAPEISIEKGVAFTGTCSMGPPAPPSG